MRRWMILNGVLAVIVLGLAIQIGRTWLRTLPPVQVPVAGKGGEAPVRSADGGKRGKRAQADKTPQTPAALVAAIAAKELFDPSRQKQSDDVKVAAPVQETAPPPGVTLVGVRAWGKDREGFLLDASQGNAQRRIRTGDTVGTYSVKLIRERSVLLVSQAGDQVTLKLEADRAKAAVTAPPRMGRGGAPPPPPASSPAAGAQGGSSPAAGVGGGAPQKPPVVAGGANPPAPGPPAPGTPPAAPPATPPAAGRGAGNPQLPSAVRDRLETIKKEQQRMKQGGSP